VRPSRCFLRRLFVEIAKVARNSVGGVPHECGAITKWVRAAKTGKCELCGGDLPSLVIKGGKAA
jgi:hypothetical protein